MNPRQRRGLLLVVLASLGALTVFFSVLVFVGQVNAKVGNLQTVVALVKPIRAYEPVSPEMIELREVPQKWLPAEAVTDARDVVGLVPTNDLPGGTYAQRGMFVDRPGVRRGFREVAILVDAETGVAGKISAGDHVDILITRELGDGKRSSAEVWVSNALITDVGITEDVSRESGREGFGVSSGKAVPVTFALPVSDALRVAYAESFAVKVRLALRGGGDSSPVQGSARVFQPGE